jgi:hypothetical protein
LRAQGRSDDAETSATLYKQSFTSAAPAASQAAASVVLDDKYVMDPETFRR